MADQTTATSGSNEPQVNTGDLALSSIALAFVLHTIKLHETADAVAFERFMLNEVFPTVDTHNAHMGETTPDQHFLLGGRGIDEYVWMIRLEYFIHHTPLPTWLGNRARESYAGVKDKIEPFGTRTATEFLYDVKEWHQQLGMG